jgi:glycosyltransferase 2 family protein
MMKSRSVLLFALVKAAVTAALLVLIFSKIDFAALARHLDGKGTLYLLLGTLLLAANILIVGFRWWLLLRRLGIKGMSLVYSLIVTYGGNFVGQATPGPLGADALRGWLCYRRGASWRPIVMSLITDRILGMLALLAVAASVWWWRFDAGTAGVGRVLAILAVIAIASGIAGLWLLPALTGRLAERFRSLRLLHDLLGAFRFTALSSAGIFGLVLSGVVVVVTVSAALVFARGFSVPLPLAAAYLVVPVAILFSMLPISIGGWGVREASVSYGLVLFGVTPADAASVGLTLGVGLLLASLPGSIVVLLMGGKVRPVPHDADGALADPPRP